MIRVTFLRVLNVFVGNQTTYMNLLSLGHVKFEDFIEIENSCRVNLATPCLTAVSLSSLAVVRPDPNTQLC